MNGVQRRLTLVLGTGLLVVLILVGIVNAESTLSDLTEAGVRETRLHAWSWEGTSIVGWLAVAPAIWWLVARVRPPRFGWAATVALLLLGSVPVSLAHVGIMVTGRHLLYAVARERYRFFGNIAERLVYEYRKDLASYCQFALVAALAQWLLARAATPPTSSGTAPAYSRTLAVSDGAVTHHLPVDEIDTVTAAANYVEIGWRGRTLLHRATLAAVAAELGDGFVRIGRSRLVRRAAIRQVAVERSGDFAVTLADGARVKGSRRYRAGIEGGDSV